MKLLEACRRLYGDEQVFGYRQEAVVLLGKVVELYGGLLFVNRHGVVPGDLESLRQVVLSEVDEYRAAVKRHTLETWCQGYVEGSRNRHDREAAL